jgi:hexokinase
MEKLIKQFDVDVTKMADVVEEFQREMERGLRGETSSLLMEPSFTDIPKGDESGTFLAIG